MNKKTNSMPMINLEVHTFQAIEAILKRTRPTFALSSNPLDWIAEVENGATAPNRKLSLISDGKTFHLKQQLGVDASAPDMLESVKVVPDTVNRDVEATKAYKIWKEGVEVHPNALEQIHGILDSDGQPYLFKCSLWDDRTPAGGHAFYIFALIPDYCDRIAVFGIPDAENDDSCRLIVKYIL